ncbi:MAG: hypothetical protein IKW60_02675 [Clostridia bacterium]|nr:hypothetical protein [Clostridia bacterium]
MNIQIAGMAVTVRGGSEYFTKRAEEYMLPLDLEGEHFFPIEIAINTMEEIPYRGVSRDEIQDNTWIMAPDKPCAIYKPLPGMTEEPCAMMEFQESCAEISILKLEENPKDHRDYIYAGLAFGHLALNYQRMVYHSSCIEVGGKAIAFSAPSGTGKSTHVGLWKKHVPDTVIINDDTPVFRFDREDAVYACGSPWSGKTDLNTNREAPLAAIVMLRQGANNSIRKLCGTEAFVRVFGQARKLPFKTSMEQVTELCEQLLSRVPVYELTCNISEDAVRVVREAIGV